MSSHIPDRDRQSQFLRGALDLCVLALLRRHPCHVYELTARLEDSGLHGVGFGTLYPLVTRLRRLDLVAEHQEPSPTGPPRKVFSLTPTGRDSLASWSAQWLASSRIVGDLISDNDKLTQEAS